MKKIILLIVGFFIFASFLSAQYEWSRASLITENNLRTAFITASGNIYVFGDNAFGAMSNDDGKSWQVIEGIDSDHRAITFALELQGGIIAINSNDLRKVYNPYWAYYDAANKWLDFSLFNTDIESIQQDNAGNVYFFPRSNEGEEPIGTVVKRTSYFDNGNISYGAQRFYNFYLPGYADHPRAEKYRYVSGLAGNGQILTCLHHTKAGAEGHRVSMLISNGHDQWKWVNYYFDDMMKYVHQIMFRDSVGFLMGSHMGATGIYLYKSTNNGNSWSLIDKLLIEDMPFPRSLYNDNYDNGNNAIIVGSMERDHYATQKPGFVKINDQAPQIISPERLNFITGKDGKFIIVGNKGVVFIGRRESPNLVEKIYASKNPKETQLFDVSGKLIKTIPTNQFDSIQSIIDLPTGTYIIKSGNQARKIMK